MSLQKQLGDYKRELADTAARNSAFTRPQAAAANPPKRAHGAAFSSSQSTTATPAAAAATAPAVAPGGHSELLTQVIYAIDYIKTKTGSLVPFDDITNYLSLPVDARKNFIPNIQKALAANERVTFIPKSQSENGKDSFKYRPPHPVTDGDELKIYLARQPTSQGISVKELKDGWPDCISAIDALEKEGHVLVIRNKKDNTPKMVWFDSPTFHVKIDSDFADFWNKTKLPSTEAEIRSELENAGLTSTSQVKEVKMMNMKKDRKRAARRGGKTTNHHMTGILKDYSKR
ncbi:transcription initiation factor IIE, beta subunit [Dissoconium aciculare CBS 342.82]|jgi:transcription initiation factor TFIIE subunit beta|uniref:Transcription initiation factor IIE subunit beta n=1 Tax=Dissoconium aciculare CBS 342.82 TaxID=1314786 RepID=A0A6J3M3A3_9PEZI|nr:transcription initiation factor IIE, beta subunit [Dissoconium aciculare CBS 342.82]KAF1822373.1 transcription initiation factor IIE, beta subunit [Dissoconium aciculare CBS 342.82]